MIEAVLDDGTVLTFPDDTDDEVINQTVKDYLESWIYMEVLVLPQKMI